MIKVTYGISLACKEKVREQPLYHLNQFAQYALTNPNATGTRTPSEGPDISLRGNAYHCILKKVKSGRKLFIKKILQHNCFPVNNAKFLRTLIFKNFLRTAASQLRRVKKPIVTYF